jgi:ArsR family transcriptional regulator
MDLAAVSSQCKAIGDPQRLRILHLLAREELTVGELVRVLELPQSTVSRQLKPLKEQGLVTDRPVGAATYYHAALDAEPGADQGALRDALARLLGESPLSPADQERLGRVLALRRGEEGQALFFDRIGLRWDALREDCFGPTFHLEAFLRLLPRQWTVADLGAGTGYLLPSLSRHFRRVVGVDVSRPMLDLAARLVAEAGLANVELRQGRLEALPLRDGEADLALCLVMMHHLEDVPAALREVRRVLRASGRLLIVEIHRHDNERFRAAMADRWLGVAPDQMRAWLVEAGFGELEFWDYPPRPRPEHELAPLPSLYGVVARKP